VWPGLSYQTGLLRDQVALNITFSQPCPLVTRGHLAASFVWKSILGTTWPAKHSPSLLSVGKKLEAEKVKNWIHRGYSLGEIGILLESLIDCSAPGVNQKWSEDLALTTSLDALIRQGWDVTHYWCHGPWNAEAWFTFHTPDGVV